MLHALPLKLSVLITMLLIPSISSAVSNSFHCTIQALKNSPVSGRSRVITFPSGVEITIVGHNHGPRDLDRALAKILNHPSLSNEDFKNQIALLLKQNQKGASHNAQDFEFLKSYLANNPGPKFIGTESTPENTRKNLEWTKDAHARILEELQKRNISSFKPFDHLLRLIVGAPIYLDRFHSSEMGETYVLGFEDAEASRQWNLAFQEKEASAKAIRELRASDEAFFQGLGGTELYLSSLYPNFDFERDAPPILTQFESQAPEKYRSVIFRWANGIFNEMKLRQVREREAANAILAQEISGLVFIGLDHLAPLSALLQAECRDLGH